MSFSRFHDFLSGLVKRQRGFFSKSESESIDDLLEKLMGSVGEVSGIVTARQVLDRYATLNLDEQLAFFHHLEQNFNADENQIKSAYAKYVSAPSSSTLSDLSKVAEPLRQELLRRLNQTPGATHDLVAMRSNLLGFLKQHPVLSAVDEDFQRLFTSWFGRGFLQLQTINWSTSAAILERIIRYEAVHAIKDWDDLRNRIDPPNRRCFAFFHPALIDEPLIFVEVALTHGIPNRIDAILDGTETELHLNHDTAVFYSISNCQPGLNNISFGNLLIKQVVQELQAEFPSIKTFVTLSPVPGFNRWLESEDSQNTAELDALKKEIAGLSFADAADETHQENIRKLVFNYLVHSKSRDKPRDPVARFHLGNGATLHEVNAGADHSDNGMQQSRGTMVNYLYDLSSIESNHEQFALEGTVNFHPKLKPLLLTS
ncbi:MAG: malonyl-CoA decarboxylase [Pseudomonadota bacterium]|nr:malonyl-CoA decarboxylase [Pseudomonadota bacterium]